MIYRIVSIKDRALDAYMQPWFVPTIGIAIRAFMDEINKKESSMYQHPDDYDLYHLGNYDDHTGGLQQLEQPQQIAIGKQLISKGT